MAFREIYNLYQSATEDEIRTAAACIVPSHYFNEDFTIETAPLDYLRGMVIDAAFEIAD